MKRCIELARKGAGFVAPNPMVGAVLVVNDLIVGEGWHQLYGEAHAEVHAINAAAEYFKQHKISQGFETSTLYVSLEPCAHIGKTPPCADLIIRNNIPRVVIGCRDPFEQVNGKGVEKLLAAGVSVEMGILEADCIALNKRFFTYHTRKRPYIILKWAETGDGKIAAGNTERLLISNEYTNRLVHRWRSEEAAILVGTNTALLDNPALNVRYWEGRPSPIRLVIDMNLRLPGSLKIFNDNLPTIIFNSNIHDIEEGMRADAIRKHIGVLHYKLEPGPSLPAALCNALYLLGIQSVLVEGGAVLLQSFIDNGLWDECRIIHNYNVEAPGGLNAPTIRNAGLVNTQKVVSDTIETYLPASVETA